MSTEQPAGPAPAQPEPEPPTEEHTEPTEQPTQPLPLVRRKIRWRMVGVVGLVVACLAVVVAGFAIMLSQGGDGRAGAGPEPPGQGAPANTATGTIDGQAEAELHLVSGATVVQVAMAEMGDTLYEVTTPDDGESVPDVIDQDGRLEVHLVPTGTPGPSRVEITLSSEVRWSVLRFSGGANEQTVDLTGGTVGQVDFAAGATRIELTLPVPEGTVPLRVSDGAGDLVVRAPAEAPVQATLSAGAGQVAVDGESHAGVAPGTVFTPEGWEQAEHRYDLDAAGLGGLTVTHTEE